MSATPPKLDKRTQSAEIAGVVPPPSEYRKMFLKRLLRKLIPKWLRRNPKPPIMH